MKIENIADLRVLVESARGGSLTAAARVLELTPAAASATLKRLETQLGARLFERSTRAMRLTDAGRTLLDYAQRALELLEEGEAQVASEGRALVGTVRLAAPSDVTRSVLLPWLDGFQAQHPGVQLVLSVSDRVQDVVRDAVDLALRYGALGDSGLSARLLYTSQPVLCAAPAYLARHGVPATPQDLARHNCLTFQIAGRRHARWRFGQGGQWVEVQVDGDRSADDASIVHQWALAGHGVCYKSRLDLVHDLASGALVHLLPDWHGPDYPLHAVLPQRRFVPARVRVLVDYLAACCAPGGALG